MFIITIYFIFLFVLFIVLLSLLLESFFVFLFFEIIVTGIAQFKYIVNTFKYVLQYMVFIDETTLQTKP